jgi:hypothetical protein
MITAGRRRVRNRQRKLSGACERMKVKTSGAVMDGGRARMRITFERQGWRTGRSQVTWEEIGDMSFQREAVVIDNSV